MPAIAPIEQLPTSFDLYRELKAVTPAPLQWLVHDLFEENTFWHLETNRATAEQTAEDAWRLALEVSASKKTIDEAGVETAMAMNDLVEIGVFEGGAPLYLEQHRITSGEQTITVTVSRKPSSAGIDPRLLLVDWNTADNSDTVSVRTAQCALALRSSDASPNQVIRPANDRADNRCRHGARPPAQSALCGGVTRVN